MLPHIVFVLWLTACSLGTPLQRHARSLKHPTSRRILIKRSHSPGRQSALAAQAAVMRKFANASALLASHDALPSYVIPPALQDIYDRASDHAANISFLSLNHTNNSIIDPLEDETDGIRDYEYYGPMRFGNQSQLLNVDFDTGSADLWVPANCNNCKGLNQFQASASSTFRNTSRPFAVKYGLGEVLGTVAHDTVAIGPLKVDNQTFGAVSSVSPNFANSPNDGLVGLAFGTISNARGPTFFENLIPLIAAPLFSVFMSRGRAYGSEICFGCIDISKTIDEHVTWVPVSSKTYWTTNMTGVLMNNSVITVNSVLALIDTGTSFIYVPKRVASALYAQVPGSAPAPGFGEGFYAYPCALPFVVSFVLGGQVLAMDARDMSLGRYADDPTNTTCISAIIGAALEFAILGDSFCKNYVTIFDYSHGARIGFVKSIDTY